MAVGKHLTYAVWLVHLPLASAQTAVLKATPTSIAFTHQVGQATLPAAQTVSASSGSSSNPLTFTATVTGGPWLTMSPAGGTTPVSARVSVNPTTLAVGTYTGAITLTTTESTPQTVVVAVTLTVRAPPPTLSATPSSVSATWVRGETPPEPISLSLATNGSLLSFTASAAGGNWLNVNPKTGIVFPAFSSALSLNLSPAGLAPGSYRGTITISAPQAANKTLTVSVNLTVNAGLPVLDTIWPAKVTQGAAATTITLSGNNFFNGTVVRAGTTTLSASYVGPNVITAVLPAALLASPGTLNITATNPGAGGGDSAAKAFTVLSSTPTINAIVNAASFAGGSVAPGAMVTLFGTGLGPDTLVTFAPPPDGSIATTLAGSQVLFDSTAAPIIFTSADQLAAMVPYDVAGKSTVQVKVDYNGTQSEAVTANVAASAPGIFTTAGTGSGAAAAFNYNEQTQTYSLNSDSALAPKGSILVFYATGEGIPVPASTDGKMVTEPSPAPNPAVTVQIGAQEATVLYAGGVVGLVSGIVQINARIPLEVTAGRAVPLMLTINGVQSQPGVTVGVK